MYIKIFFALVITTCLCGCMGPVLQVGDTFVPVRKYKGVPVLSLRNSIFKEVRYSTFAFDWDENDGFIIPVRQNSLNKALWISDLTRAEKLYSVVFMASKQRHYIQKPDIKILQKYLENACRQLPGSKLKRTALKIEPREFKGIPALGVYMETFEEGRGLYMREESCYFFDPVQPDSFIYQISWSERGKEKDWRSPAAEKQGKYFFLRFKLLAGQK